MAGMVIIGAGECGVRAAFALRENGFGGDITLIGDEASLPYERPPLSKEIPVAPKPIRLEEAYLQAGIKLKRGVRVQAIDRAQKTVHLADNSAIEYDKLLLATGAKARKFPGMEECQTMRTDSDAAAILSKLGAGAKIGIIGGGFIGLELAAVARKAGADVTVVEAAPRILGRAVPEAIAAVLHDRHVAEGVDLMTGTGVSKADATSILLADGRQLEFDLVVAGVGAMPKTALAEAAGLEVANGVVVDGDFRSSDPDIFAAGDCCNFEWQGARVRLESWKAAQDQGAHAAAAMLGAGETYSKVPWFWSDQYDMSLQVAGLFDMGGEIHQRPSEEGIVIVFQCDATGKLAAAAGIGTGNAVAKDIKIFEKLIERGASVNPAELADPATNLKRLLKAA